MKENIKMRTKRCMIILILITILITIIWLLKSPTPHLRSFVSQTQLHIKNINSKLQVLDKKELDVESTYLELLGFVARPKLFNYTMATTGDRIDDHINDIPIFVTAFTRFSANEKLLIESKLKYFPKNLIFIYDIDLSFSEQLKLQKLCNISCKFKTFKAEKYPKHILQTKLKAYKPIVIQEMLNEYGSLIWIEPPNVIISNDIEKHLNKSKINGLVIWPSKEPITQMTHPSMFKYFTLKPSDFYFVHMLDTTHLFIVNMKHIHNDLMLPWVKCALKEDCISPPGAQLSGCDFNRRPEFLYSGCHRYESSSLSIIAALLFNFDSSKYTIDSDTPSFCILVDEFYKSTKNYFYTSNGIV